MKHRLILFCLLSFSLAASAQAQTAYTKTSLSCCAAKKAEPKVAVVLQTSGQNISASVKESNAKSLHFYLFDVEGTMIHQAVLAKEKNVRISDLKKGTYIYTVFANDESIDEGKIEIK